MFEQDLDNGHIFVAPWWTIARFLISISLGEDDIQNLYCALLEGGWPEVAEVPVRLSGISECISLMVEASRTPSSHLPGLNMLENYQRVGTGYHGPRPAGAVSV